MSERLPEPAETLWASVTIDLVQLYADALGLENER